MDMLAFPRRWLGQVLRPERPPERSSDRQRTQADLAAIRHAMAALMASCSTAHQSRAAVQIARAVTLQDLWLLRGDLYLYLAQDLDQREASMRIAGLEPLFGWFERGGTATRRPGASMRQAGRAADLP